MADRRALGRDFQLPGQLQRAGLDELIYGIGVIHHDDVHGAERLIARSREQQRPIFRFDFNTPRILLKTVYNTKKRVLLRSFFRLLDTDMACL